MTMADFFNLISLMSLCTKKYDHYITCVNILFCKLATSISRDWKDLLLRQHMSSYSNSFGFAFEQESKMFAKDFYSLFIDQKNVSPNSRYI